MQNAPPVQRPQQPVPQQSQADFDKTVSIYSTTAEETPSAPVSAPAQPVVGWLVCVEGMDRGRDYRLIAGHNFIGRGRDMNVSIEGDLAISRSKHAILTYDPQANSFFVQPGESHELCYLNNKVVLDHVLLKQGDMLSLGNTKLLFVPCCTDAFNWGKDMKGGTGNA